MTVASVLFVLGCAGGERAEVAGVADAAVDGQPADSGSDPPAAMKLLPGGPSDADYPHLPSLMQVSGRIYSGGEPVGDEAFAELAKLGVRTVVSVDGARPNVELAERHGLRYVHIPVGYDGISTEAGRSLARLVREAEGPFYVHCHHGVHRGPAAAAVACVADGAASGKEALAVLEKAKTSKGYAGLWRDVESYEPPASGETLAELVAVAEVGSLASAMALIDRASDNLKLCQGADWQTPPGHPDVAPAQEALLLKEGFHETVRQLGESNQHDEQFAAWMRASEQSAASLEAALNAGDKATAAQVVLAVQAECKRCHAEYRD